MEGFLLVKEDMNESDKCWKEQKRKLLEMSCMFCSYLSPRERVANEMAAQKDKADPIVLHFVRPHSSHYQRSPLHQFKFIFIFIFANLPRSIDISKAKQLTLCQIILLIFQPK